ncbi:MAG: prepilin peptidase [Phycisphaerae bacterium]
MSLDVAWWLFFWTALGLCIGSFLNVVIYRIPLDGSLRSPTWSACPYCRGRIAWYDNIPILSFLLLRGRCRHCHAPIATRYVVIEAATALVVLVLFDAFFVGQARVGLSASMFGVGDRLSYDWPILVAHIVLFACLLSMSVIDLEHYWVDVRFTNLAVAAGFALHIIWTPKHHPEWIRPLDTTAMVAIFTLIGLGVTWMVVVCRPEVEPEDPRVDRASAPDPAAFSQVAKRPRAPLKPPPRVAGWIAGILLAALVVALFLDETGRYPLKHAPRAVIPMVLLFFLIVSESTVARESDDAIMEAIEEERHESRKMVLAELGMLLPAALCGLIGWWVMRGSGDFAAHVHAAMGEGTRVSSLAFLRSWSPLMGLGTAATGYVVAGALGWLVRIFFTLVFGKEAFGAGDIHLMAAAGCIAGWPVVVLGFFLTCGLALLGWAMTLPFKRTRALPLGPWLSLSFLVVVVFYDRILVWPAVARTIEAAHMLFLDNSHVATVGGFG